MSDKDIFAGVYAQQAARRQTMLDEFARGPAPSQEAAASPISDSATEPATGSEASPDLSAAQTAEAEGGAATQG